VDHRAKAAGDGDRVAGDTGAFADGLAVLVDPDDVDGLDAPVAVRRGHHAGRKHRHAQPGRPGGGAVAQRRPRVDHQRHLDPGGDQLTHQVVDAVVGGGGDDPVPRLDLDVRHVHEHDPQVRRVVRVELDPVVLVPSIEVVGAHVTDHTGHGRQHGRVVAQHDVDRGGRRWDPAT
jgi:hypothetical protein